jgi:NitT/TauT family transport system permease protein
MKRTEKVWPVLQIKAFIADFLVNILVPTAQSVYMRPYRIFLISLIIFFTVRFILSFFNKRVKVINNYKSQFYFAAGIALGLWDLSTAKLNLLPLPFFPSLAQILQVMAEDANVLLISTLFSLRLLVIGFTIGTIVGLISGVLIGWYNGWNYWLFPVIKVMGVIPATAWIPITMFIFPSSFYAQIFLIVLCVWFPVAYMASGGIANIQKSYFEAARTLGADEKFLIFKIAIPGAMPSIFTGIYTGTGISFATLVVSEIIGAKAGLGWYINWAKSWSNYAKVYASIIVMAVVFSLVMAGIFKIRDRVLIWQKGLLK